MDPKVFQIIGRFRPVSLMDLNARAAMLERLDNKYIVPADRLCPALEAFSDSFDVLEIDGRRSFTYATRYFDDENLQTYYDHHQGRRKRCKIRVRDYVDAGFSYLEIKLKDKRKITVKRRLKVDDALERLDGACIDFVERSHRDLYDEPLDLTLRQVISMRYERVTLVARDGGERMTIDTSLRFSANGLRSKVPPGLFIVETKSARGNGIADRILRSLQLHPTAHCSKYCVGLAALGAGGAAKPLSAGAAAAATDRRTADGYPPRNACRRLSGSEDVPSSSDKDMIMPMPNHAVRAMCCAAALCTPQLALAQTEGLKVDVLDSVILEGPRIDGLKIAELSGLAYDRQNGGLIAVSDKGRLFKFALDLTGDRIAALEPLKGHELLDADGARIRDDGFNAEGIALAGDGTLAVVSENGPRIARFTMDGKWLEDMLVPAALSDPAAQRSDKDGLEALAIHPVLGLLTLPEEPLAAEDRTTHTIHAGNGTTLAFDTTATGTTSIKGMEVLSDGRIAMIERDVSDTDKSLIPYLRILDPAACAADGVCPTQVARIEVPDIADADFEGITQLSDDLLLIVSDDKIDSVRRSVFGLLRMTPAAAGRGDETG